MKGTSLSLLKRLIYTHLFYNCVAPVEVVPEVKPVPNVKGCALTLRNIRNLKEEILSRPTFFEHYDRVVIDYRYPEEREEAVLIQEGGWLRRQKLKISVDLTSGLNLFRICAL